MIPQEGMLAASEDGSGTFGAAASAHACGPAYVKYGDQAASTRQRLLQFVPYFRAEGIDVSIRTLFPNSALQRFNATGERSSVQVMRAYADRMREIGRSGKSQFIWVSRELFPYLPGWTDCALLPNGVPVIYDYDDAIFHQYDSHPNPLIRNLLGRRLEPLLQRANLAVCGNAYLEAYAARFCRRTEIVPTVVDIDVYKPVSRAGQPRGPATIGWIGSPSTWPYVRSVLPVLEAEAAEHDLRISVIGAGPKGDVGPRIVHEDWVEEREVAMIQKMDIGIMPLPDEPWARGKCGYKLIQYMACGLPVIASPVGVNAEIVAHGISGFLVRTEREWADAIRCLARDPELRASMGAKGRRQVEERYSLQVHGPRLAGLIHGVVDESLARQ